MPGKDYTALKLKIGLGLFLFMVLVHIYLLHNFGEGFHPVLLGMPFGLMGVDNGIFSVFKK